MESMIQLESIFAGVLLGTAVGDALGLPRENMSAARAKRWWRSEPLRHRFILGRGMVSDDTEHTCLVAQALLASGGISEQFGIELAARLRWWLAACPAGLGRATLLGTLRLWCGYHPANSGVYSAGNGPAMRSAMLGIWAGEDVDYLRTLVHISTHITHTHPDAEHGALAVALSARFAARNRTAHFNPHELLAELKHHMPVGAMSGQLDLVARHLASNSTPEVFAAELGCRQGVSGYVLHTVPAALFCWLKFPHEFPTAVEQVIQLGGDTDTTGAIVGALAGVVHGATAIPPAWLDGLWEWPRSVDWMKRLALRLSEARMADDPSNVKPLPWRWPLVIPRNAIFLLTVLVHALRRLAPPY